MRNPKIKAFAEKWLAYFNGPNFTPGRETPEFTEEAVSKDIGFKSNGGVTLINAVGRDVASEAYKTAEGFKKNQAAITDIQALGDTIVSKYRGYRTNYILEVDGEWFAAALARLKELAE